MPVAQECHELPWPETGMFSIRGPAADDEYSKCRFEKQQQQQ